MKYILHGKDDDLEIEQAKKILDARKIPYRLELGSTDSGDIELISPVSRLVGLRDLDLMFGNHSLETETA